jgi:transcriptional regulator with XRE-family HTH domain
MNTDAKTAIGRMVRLLRESAGLSQENLAEHAGMTYQYLSAVENGKENFTIGMLESIAAALGLTFPELVERSFTDDKPPPVVKKERFIQNAKLPPCLTVSELELALNETHRVVRLINTTLRRVSGRPLSGYIQGNNFSGIVSNILCDSFSRLTSFKHNHDQRYPDLVCKDTKGKTLAGLEVKSTIRPGKGGESHNGHSGWHVVACFSSDRDSGDIRYIHVMFADLIGHDKPNADWKYVGSKVNKDAGSQRTETYVTTGVGTAKLRHGTVYLDTDMVNIARWRTSPKVKASAHSPFANRHIQR